MKKIIKIRLIVKQEKEKKSCFNEDLFYVVLWKT